MALLDELNVIWEEVKKKFVEELTEPIADLWFAELKLISYDDGIITFSTESKLKHKILTEKYLDRMAAGLAEFLGPDVRVALKLVPKTKPDLPIAAEVMRQMPFLANRDKTITDPVEAAELGSEDFPFRFEYTFENFIVGSSNKFAHAACLAVANNPAFLENNENSLSAYNPLFIYGPSGIGKTHLLHAVVNRISEKMPGCRILYIKGDDFTNQLIDHLSKKTMNQFKEKYRKCDVLLIDDIQFIAGKASTQEEFFHTFNALYDEHKQIILTSDRPPREIKPLEDRLVTRFEWGLLADIQPPDQELRVAILKAKAQQANIVIPEDVLDFLAENLRSNVRQIEGAIKKLGAVSFLSGREINMALAKECIVELLGGDEPVSITVDRIFAAITRRYGVKKDDLISEKRNKEIAYARHISVYLVREITDMSFPNMARLFGKKNHTTILSSYQLVENKISTDPVYAAEVESLKKELLQK